MQLHPITAYKAYNTVYYLLLDNVAIYAGWTKYTARKNIISVIFTHLTYHIYSPLFLKDTKEYLAHKIYSQFKYSTNMVQINPILVLRN